MVQEKINAVKRNIDPTIVVSTVVAAFVIGGLVVLAKKSGIKPLKQVADVVK